MKSIQWSQGFGLRVVDLATRADRLQDWSDHWSDQTNCPTVLCRAQLMSSCVLQCHSLNALLKLSCTYFPAVTLLGDMTVQRMTESSVLCFIGHRHCMTKAVADSSSSLIQHFHSFFLSKYCLFSTFINTNIGIWSAIIQSLNHSFIHCKI